MKKSMKKMILKGVPLLMAVLLCFMPMQVHAAPSESLLLCAALDEENLLNAGAGIAFKLNGAKYILSNDGLCVDGCDDYRFVDDDAGKYVPMEYLGIEWGMSLFAVSADSSDLFFDVSTPVIGESATLKFFSRSDESLEIRSINVNITGYTLSDDACILDVEITGDLNNGLAPGVIINSGGQMVAAVSGNGSVYALLEPISGSSGGSSDTPEPTDSTDSTDEGNRPSRGDSGGGTPGTTDEPGITDEPGTTDESGTTDEPAKTDTPGVGDDDDKMIYWIIIAAAAAVVVVLVVVMIIVVNKSKKQTKTIPAAPVSPPQSNFGTDQSFDQKTMPVWEHVQAENPPFPPNEGTKSIELYLVGEGGPLNGLKYHISEKTITIGRAVECSICYPADTKGVSRRHCQIFWKNGVLMIMDLGSTSGTFLREKGQLQPNTPTAIKEGDVIYLGSKQNALTIQVKGKS